LVDPIWSYMYHRMAPPFVAAGCRLAAPALIGCGRSDKPTRPEAYSYQSHVDWLESWLLQLDLQGVTLFCQDWGGLLGLRVVAAHPDRFDRVVASNTWLPTGDERPTEAFLNWQSYAANAPGCRSPRSSRTRL